MSEAPRLYQLQAIDLELDEKRRQLQEAEAGFGETAALRDSREQLAAAEHQYEELKQGMRRLEGEIEAKSAKSAGLQKQLFGGVVGKQKEASALEKELQALKTERGRLEDQLLDAMAEVEEWPPKLAELREEVKRAESTWAKGQGELQRQIERLNQELAAAESERQRLAAGIPAATMAIYEDLRRRHKGRAVARIERNTCMGCRVALPMGEVQRVRTSRDLSRCSVCGRIVFVER